MPQKCQIKLKLMEWCIKPTKLQFQSILTRKILMLSNATAQTSCQERVESDNIQNEKFLPTVGLEIKVLRFLA